MGIKKMKKGPSQKGQTTDNKQKAFDDVFAKYSAQLTPDYTKQFKRPESTAGAKQVKMRTAQRQGKVEVVHKAGGNKKNEIQNIGALLDDEAIIEIKTTPKEIAKQVSEKRNELKMTQSDLAKKIGEPVADLTDLENCSGAYKPDLVIKIEKALKIKIDRPWKKKK